MRRFFSQLFSMALCIAVGAAPSSADTLFAKTASAVPPTTMQRPASSKSTEGAYSVVYRFKGAPDGSEPLNGGIVSVNGTLYGTTATGGIVPPAGQSLGTVYKISPSGTESVVYRFKGSPDGANPSGPLVEANGTVYGTATSGGAGICSPLGCGTVFALNPSSGAEHTLYSFRYGIDANTPQSGLNVIGDAVYGATSYGGTYGQGTVFEISLSGFEFVLYSFTGGTDGGAAGGAPIGFGGALYGTTGVGGGVNGNSNGVLYQIGAPGAERVVHAFAGKDGSGPSGALLAINGAFYGTTFAGGVFGRGTVFMRRTDGSGTVLHSFGNGTDGNGPFPLAYLNGRLYGTTTGGGLYGFGTIFAITASGGYQILHNFANAPDGAYPNSLVAVSGVLYGTTQAGGTASGNGTVFALKP